MLRNRALSVGHGIRGELHLLWREPNCLDVLRKSERFTFFFFSFLSENVCCSYLHLPKAEHADPGPAKYSLYFKLTHNFIELKAVCSFPYSSSPALLVN